MHRNRKSLGHLCAAASAIILPFTSSACATSPSTETVSTDRYQEFTPDPESVKFILPDDIPWQGEPGRLETYNMVGHPSEPGTYVLLLKWWPNQFSKPHMHGKTRYITVISGTWWMSSDASYDPKKTYPLPAGTAVVHEANEVHWDGAKEEPVVLMIAGDGPANTIFVDETGSPIPKRNN